METQNDNFNAYDEFNELDEMRQQLNDVKNKVEKQGHLNEELVKRVVQDKMKSVHRTVFQLAALAIAATPIYIFLKYQAGLSWALVIFTIVMLLGFIIADYFINHMDINHMGDDMIETARKLTQMKKNRSISQKIGLAVCVPWLAWFGYEYYQYNLSHFGQDNALFTLLPIAIGAIAGATIGIIIYRRMQRTNDEMIDQINELTREQ
ncbi:MAG: hypothetical protein IKW85_08820 [Muribaculaceae bacterium]|nr:hypothetical protein [Muribaculaceae bacterium]